MSKVKSHFDKISSTYDSGKKRYDYYYSNIKKLLSSIIPNKSKVLEVGCGTGDLLASLKPAKGYGMDISSKMIGIATQKHKNLKFSVNFPKDKYEYIFMTDVIEHMEDPLLEFRSISSLMGRNSKFIITMANPLWEPLLMFWERIGLKMKEGPHQRIVFAEIKRFLQMCNLKVIIHDYKLLIPVKIPLLTYLVNRYLEKYLKKYAFIEYIVAQKA